MEKPGNMGKRRQNAEAQRLSEADAKTADWRFWGCYLSERAWGTVREDYSPDGSAWDYFPFEQSHLKAYRWNEDGIAGICDRRQRLCFAIALWNGKDPVIKERLFGLAGPKGNHGEDVKEYYFYLDNTPTHSYMKYLYKYPQAEFPYRELYEENGRRGKSDPEFELLDTGIFDDDKYFDVVIEYAKAGIEDTWIKITAINRGDAAAPLHLLPTVWFRNTWSWDLTLPKPNLKRSDDGGSGISSILIDEKELGTYSLLCKGPAELLFAENESNYQKLYNGTNASATAKDGINKI